MTSREIQCEFRACADVDDAVNLSRFFKTDSGDYGEGDIFLGIRVPVIRKFTKRYAAELSLRSVRALLKSRYHEERLLALLIMVRQFKGAESSKQESLYDLYLSHTAYVNNWDLVDLSAEHIVGVWLYTRKRDLLYQLAESENLWEKRIAILATFYFIRKNDFNDTIAIAEKLRNDKHDLIHKAVGWMLREVGNRDRSVEEKFLKKYLSEMPRTMLRYAIERFPEPLRLAYLNGTTLD